MTAAQLKASLLDRAIRGLLVPQDPHDEPAEALLARIREERAAACSDDSHTEARRHGGRARRPATAAPHPVPDDEKPFDIPKSWQWVRLGDIVRTPIQNGYSPNAVNQETSTKRLTLTATTSGEFNPTGFRYVSEAIDADSHLWLTPGDILIQRSNTIDYVGMSCVFTGAKHEFIYPDLMMKVQLDSRFLDVKFVNFALQAPTTHLYFRDHATGTAGTMPKINGATVKATLLPIPPLAEQRRIVAAVEELMPLVKRYEAAEAKRARLDAALPDALRKSILKAAFDGALPGGCAFEEMPLERACAAVFTGNSLSDAEKRAFTRPDGLPFVGTKDVGFDQRIDYENGIRIPADAAYRTAPAGATLLCIEGGSSGRKIGLLDRAVRFGNKLCAFVPGEGLESRYLFLYLQSPQFLEQFAALQNGPRKGAGLSQIKTLTIRMTSLPRQRQLVEAIDSLLRQANAIASVTQAG